MLGNMTKIFVDLRTLAISEKEICKDIKRADDIENVVDC